MTIFSLQIYDKIMTKSMAEQKRIFHKMVIRCRSMGLLGSKSCLASGLKCQPSSLPFILVDCN